MALSLDDAIFTKLSTTSGITGICGTRVYPQDLPQGVTLPAITYQLVSNPVEATHDESPGSSLSHPRVQITAWSTTHLGSVTLAAAIFSALHGFKGTVTSGQNSLQILGSLRVDKRASKEPVSGIYTRQQDFEIWYIE